MCGIAGFVKRLDSPPASAGRMAQKLVHRGPDGAGLWQSTWQSWSIELAHRRLSIIDLSGGAQPMGNETGSLQITFNGEIFNFLQLRPKLESQGHTFHTRSDTETIIHHIEQHGPAGISDLNGMFAFALWDQSGGTLTLARDRAGIKPLFYAILPDGGLAFSSELTSLLEFPGISRDIDPEGLASLLFRDYIVPPRTVLRSVRKLEPGHMLTWKDGQIEGPHAFWKLDLSRPGCDESSADRLCDQLRERVSKSVANQLIADVPVGVFLSGGIDSSLVAAMAQRHHSSPLLTFSIGFADAEFDESAYARRVAEHLGTHHIERRFDEAQLVESLDPALSALDEPIGDPSILPTYLVSSVAAQHVKVVLGGDGGDELFGGYPTYKAHRLARIFGLLPRFLRNGVVAPLVRCLPVRDGYQSLEWKLKRFILRWDDDLILRHQRWMSAADLPELADVLASPCDPLIRPDCPWLPTRGDDALNNILALDFSTYMSGSVLTKVDRASMAHGLEVRPPLLDNRVIDLAFSLSSRWKVRRQKTKWLLKRAASPLLPSEIVNRPKKGFAIPLARWLAGPLKHRMQSILADGPLWDMGLLRREALAAWLDEQWSRTRDHSKPLWSLLVLDHWLRRVRG